jgi:hypothetical protein
MGDAGGGEAVRPCSSSSLHVSSSEKTPVGTSLARNTATRRQFHRAERPATNFRRGNGCNRRRAAQVARPCWWDGCTNKPIKHDVAALICMHTRCPPHLQDGSAARHLHRPNPADLVQHQPLRRRDLIRCRSSFHPGGTLALDFTRVHSGYIFLTIWYSKPFMRCQSSPTAPVAEACKRDPVPMCIYSLSNNGKNDNRVRRTLVMCRMSIPKTPSNKQTKLASKASTDTKRQSMCISQTAT